MGDFNDIVYVSKNGRVIHLTSACVLLKGKDIRKVKLIDVYAEMDRVSRKKGRKFVPSICQKCIKKIR